MVQEEVTAGGAWEEAGTYRGGEVVEDSSAAVGAATSKTGMGAVDGTLAGEEGAVEEMVI